MRFVIDAPHRGSGLKVIPEIPDYAVCRLEGSNGIGKTLAIHLLELATGQQPFLRQPLAWGSLQAAIGPVTITIEKIPDHSDIVVHLNPELWNPESPADPRSSYGTAETDGRRLSLTDVGRIVRVIRISGDETLEDAVRDLVEDDQAAVERVSTEVHVRRTAIAGQLGVLNDLVASIVPERLSFEEERFASLGQRAREQSTLLDAAIDKQGRFGSALSLSDQLEAATLTAPQLEKESELTRSRISELEKERDTLDRQRRDLEPQMSREKAVVEQVTKAQQLRNTRARRLLDLTTDVTVLTETTGVSDQSPAVQVAIEKATGHIASLRERIASLDTQGVILGVMDQMTTPLDGARIRGFGGEVIAKFDGNYERVFGRPTDLLVKDLIAGLGRQRSVISQRQRSREEEALRSQLRAEQLNLESLQRLSDLLHRRDRAVELLREIDDELRLLARSETGAVADEYRRIIGRLAEIDDRIREASVRAVELAHRIQLVTGGQTPDQIRASLRRVLDTLEIGTADVPNAARSHQARVQELERGLAETSSELDDSRLLLEAMRSQVRPVLQELARHPGVPWIHDLVRAELETAGNEMDRLSALVGRLHEASIRVEQRVNQLADDVEAFRAALADLARMVSARETTTDVSLPRLYAPELRTVFSKRLRSDFSQKEVTDALFDAGEVVEVDLARLEVTWRTHEGEVRTRPFEAFSSGERTFAYTRARIESIAHVQSKYRVIVLDEFGAFLARDRLDALVRYIQDAVIGTVAAQVVLILPLSTELPHPGDALDGSERFRERAAALDRRQYFAENAAYPAT